MTQVFISVGSNIEQEKHICAGLLALDKRYQPITCSTVFESESVGFAGDNFYNLVVAFHTTDSVAQVSAYLSLIEDENGRDRSGPRFSSRTLDLDLLLFGDTVVNSNDIVLPRPEIYDNAFVLLPLSQIAAKLTDPIKKLDYSTLWKNFDQKKQKLWPITFPFPATINSSLEKQV